MNIFLKSAGKQEGTSCVSNMVQLGRLLLFKWSDWTW